MQHCIVVVLFCCCCSINITAWWCRCLIDTYRCCCVHHLPFVIHLKNDLSFCSKQKRVDINSLVLQTAASRLCSMIVLQPSPNGIPGRWVCRHTSNVADYNKLAVGKSTKVHGRFRAVVCGALRLRIRLQVGALCVGSTFASHWPNTSFFGWLLTSHLYSYQAIILVDSSQVTDRPTEQATLPTERDCCCPVNYIRRAHFRLLLYRVQERAIVVLLCGASLVSYDHHHRSVGLLLSTRPSSSVCFFFVLLALGTGRLA